MVVHIKQNWGPYSMKKRKPKDFSGESEENCFKKRKTIEPRKKEKEKVFLWTGRHILDIFGTISTAIMTHMLLMLLFLRGQRTKFKKLYGG